MNDTFYFFVWNNNEQGNFRNKKKVEINVIIGPL